jgi:hypothetical protein
MKILLVKYKVAYFYRSLLKGASLLFFNRAGLFDKDFIRLKEQSGIAELFCIKNLQLKFLFPSHLGFLDSGSTVVLVKNKALSFKDVPIKSFKFSLICGIVDKNFFNLTELCTIFKQTEFSLLTIVNSFVFFVIFSVLILIVYFIKSIFFQCRLLIN